MSGILPTNIYFILQGLLTFRRILRLKTDSFTFPPKEAVLRIVIALKNPSHSAELKPRTLGPMVEK
jgi:hypothetical protein